MRLSGSMEEPYCSNRNCLPTNIISQNVQSNSMHNKTSSLEYYCGTGRSETYKNVQNTCVNGVINASRNINKFGGPEARSSYNEHCSSRFNSGTGSQSSKLDKSPHRSQSERTTRWIWDDDSPVSPRSGLYRSNSSLDLDEMLDEKAMGLRREYGSASSIDVISTTGESFFAMLRDYGTENADQRSPGPAKIADYLRGKIEYTPTTQNASNTLANGPESLEDMSSPKIKSKFHKLWESKEKKTKSKQVNNELSIFRKLRGTKSDSVGETISKGSDNSLDAEMKAEEKLHRKVFAHYDIQSITANLCYTAQLRSILSRRRNTTTGASAASMIGRNTNHDNVEDLFLEENDNGDGRNNDLVCSCPFFRNELGGEEERTISLTRTTSKKPKNTEETKFNLLPLHKPNMVCGLSVLEGANENYWKKWKCPYQKHNLQIENVDNGVFYYKKYFFGKDHQNWFGVDDSLGPVAVSIIKEKIEENGINNKENSTSPQYQYRLIIRTSELTTLRGSILEDAIPSLKHNNHRGIPAKELLECVAPELQVSSLRLGILNSHVEDQLLKLDQQGLTNTYKVGVMYCKAGQSTEEEMYNNEHSGPAFDEFLEMLGEKVRLKGFTKYRAQLDNKTDSTGLYSVYASFQDCEIMFHVSTMLPYTPNNKQQLLRKRHIGNDIVTIVFQESDALPFTPKNIRSHFQHVFIIVRVSNPCSENTRYRVAISRSKEVSVFGPPIPEGAIFMKSKAFAEFLLAKVINAENAAHKSEKFATMATRTRQEYLKDLATNCVTNTTFDSSSKFSMLSFGGRKKERTRVRFFPDAYVKGAVVWQVHVEDYGEACICNCHLGISTDTLILIEESTREAIFVTPNHAILGWSSQTNSLKIYYHQGECIVLRTRDPDVDEIQEIVSRLSNVTQGCETQEITLRRNNLGQLGFHVQHDGTITEVEQHGFAWQTGLRQGSRLVEICKIVISSLTHEQMVDLLKTSMTVTVTVIPPLPDGTARRGCGLHNCSYLTSNLLMSDYENLGNCEVEDNLSKLKGYPRQQIAQSQIKVVRNDSNTSPPRSSASSGYGSSRSGFNNATEHRFGLLTSSSSQSSEEKWYDVGENADTDERNLPCTTGFSLNSKNSSPPPPPLPARLIPNLHSAFSQVLPKHRDSQIRHTTSRSFDFNSNSYVQSQCYNIEQSLKQKSRSEQQTDQINSDYSRSDYLSDLRQEHVSQLSASITPFNKNRDFEKLKAAVLASPAIVISDGLSDSSSDRFQGTRSEDELSGSSNSLSPRCRRRWPPESWGTGSSGNSSRNQSPHITNKNSVDTGEPKLKSVISNRTSNRNSGVNVSTFQENLLKLINPDLINKQEEKFASDSNHSQNNMPVKTEEEPSKDDKKVSNQVSSSSSRTPNVDVIFTTARPATVISTTSSSPAPSENKLKIERSSNVAAASSLSSSVNNKFQSKVPSSESVPLPEGKEIDWASLVDTATKAMQIVGLPASSKSTTRYEMWIDDDADRLGLDSLPNSKSLEKEGDSARRVRELEVRIKTLETELERERHRKAALEIEVHTLREENMRLQEESRTSADQLRRFTEWFFQTIDRQ